MLSSSASKPTMELFPPLPESVAIFLLSVAADRAQQMLLYCAIVPGTRIPFCVGTKLLSRDFGQK
jgi:hypothetical protein